MLYEVITIIDVGFKVEGRVDLKEFSAPGKPAELAVGDEVEVFLDRVENARGEAMISRDKARREEAWDRLVITSYSIHYTKLYETTTPPGAAPH